MGYPTLSLWAFKVLLQQFQAWTNLWLPLLSPFACLSFAAGCRAQVSQPKDLICSLSPSRAFLPVLHHSQSSNLPEPLCSHLYNKVNTLPGAGERTCYSVKLWKRAILFQKPEQEC